MAGSYVSATNTLDISTSRASLCKFVYVPYLRLGGSHVLEDSTSNPQEVGPRRPTGVNGLVKWSTPRGACPSPKLLDISPSFKRGGDGGWHIDQPINQNALKFPSVAPKSLKRVPS